MLVRYLSHFTFSVEYRPGHKHWNADSINRSKNPAVCTCPETNNLIYLKYLKCGTCNKCQKDMFEMCSFFLQQSSREQDLDIRTFTNSLETCNHEAQQQSQQTGVVTTRQQTS